MNTNVVSQKALQLRNYCAADNGRYQQARAFSCERPKTGNGQRKNAGKHNGIEQADEDEAPHGNVSEGEHGSCNQQRRCQAVYRQQRLCSDSLQQC